MIGVMLFMIVGGIGLAQAVSHPHQVTLGWLRLGGIIAVSLLVLAVAFGVWTGAVWPIFWLGLGLTAAAMMTQLITVQLAMRTIQRLAACIAFVVAASSSAWTLLELAMPQPLEQPWGMILSQVLLSAPLSSGLLGGFLMTMLLGHAYLTAGGAMTQTPFLRLVRVLAMLLGLRIAASLLFGLSPHWRVQIGSGYDRSWLTMMITARYAVGLAVPLVFIYMVYDCVRRRSNQSATGILYVTTVLVVIGEGLAMALFGSTGRVF